MVEFSQSGQEKQNKAASGKKNGTVEMTFTGSLIESLMATVERAEQRAQSDGALAVEPLLVEPWFASVQENADYDSKFLGVA